MEKVNYGKILDDKLSELEKNKVNRDELKALKNLEGK